MRGRVILLVVLVLVVVGVIAAALLLSPSDDPDPEATLTQAEIDGSATAIASGVVDVGTPVPGETGPDPNTTLQAASTDFAPIVIALQNLPRGFRITSDQLQGAAAAVGVVLWPVESIPSEGTFAAVEALQDTLVRSDIPRGSPVLSTQVVTDPLSLAQVGSDAALLLEPGQVAISMPIDLLGIGSVAYGLQPGDFVDVIFSFLFIEVDETFQSRQPNGISVITRNETGDLEFGSPLEGRPEPSPLSALGVLVSPSERQRPRLVTQRTVTGAKVIHVGYFPADGKILGLRTATPTPFETATAGGDGSEQQQAPPTPIPTNTPYTPTIITIGVDPQDALVLIWALDSQIPITYALRAAGDQGADPAATTAVTLQYLIENYSISQPPILPFALEPAIESLRGSGLDIFSNFSAGDGAAPNAGAGGQ